MEGEIDEVDYQEGAYQDELLLTALCLSVGCRLCLCGTHSLVDGLVWPQQHQLHLGQLARCFACERQIGREAELDGLRSHLAVAPLVSLHGPAGVGKSRLLRELAPGLI